MNYKYVSSIELHNSEDKANAFVASYFWGSTPAEMQGKIHENKIFVHPLLMVEDMKKDDWFLLSSHSYLNQNRTLIEKYFFGKNE